MNVRRLQLDVDKAVQRPDLLELAEAIDGVPGDQVKGNLKQASTK